MGYAVPSEFGALIDMLFNRVPNIDQAVISDCHNDLGLAVDSLAAVNAALAKLSAPSTAGACRECGHGRDRDGASYSPR